MVISAGGNALSAATVRVAKTFAGMTAQADETGCGRCFNEGEVELLRTPGVPLPTEAQPDGDVEFVITVKEFVDRNIYHMRFFAQADKQTNQKTAPFVPCGWGESLLQALSECVRAIHRFPYEGEGIHKRGE